MHSFVTSKNAQWPRLIWPTLYIVAQTMAASKRANAIPPAFVARQSLNDEELVSMNSLI